MSKAKGAGEDRKNFFKLVEALENAGIDGAHKIAELIATMVNHKIEHSEGKHHARFHNTCEWSEIEEGSGIYNTCKDGEEFHLTEGLELYPFCQWCGRQIKVVALV